MKWLIIVSFLLLLPTANKNQPCCKCLPSGIQQEDVVSAVGFKRREVVTVAQKLRSLKARCKRGRLVDSNGRAIYFFRLTGCWGNPPDNYQEILEKQNKELIRLRKRYTVIEMTCNPSGQQIP